MTITAPNNQTPFYREVLDGIEFPITRAELVQYAEENDASTEVVTELRAMPDLEYESYADIDKNFGKARPLPDHGMSEASQDSPKKNRG